MVVCMLWKHAVKVRFLDGPRPCSYIGSTLDCESNRSGSIPLHGIPILAYEVKPPLVEWIKWMQVPYMGQQISVGG